MRLIQNTSYIGTTVVLITFLLVGGATKVERYIKFYLLKVDRLTTKFMS